MKVLLELNQTKDVDFKITNEIIDHLVLKGVQVYIEKELMGKVANVRVIDHASIANIDLSIVLGGDGTVLKAAHKFEKYDFPFLGINLGRVGCLSEATPTNYKEVIDKVLEGQYQIQNRIVLKVGLYHKNSLIREINAYNELAITRGMLLKMINIGIKVNDNNDTNFYADGIIVATPTGTSAYNLSAGGPLLIPTAKSFVITPICPQLKTITSLVVDGDDKITLSLHDEYKDTFPQLQVDGMEAIDFGNEDTIVLSKSTKLFKIIKINTNESLYEPIFKVTKAFK